MDRCSVLVPRKGTLAASMFDRASAVVTDGNVVEGKILVWYEGNRHGACNLNTFYERILSAAGRLAVSYPTTAKAMLPREDFVEAAVFSMDRLAFSEVAEPGVLAEWAGEAMETIRGTRLEPGVYGRDRWPPKDELSYVTRLPDDVMAFRSKAGQLFLTGTDAFEVLQDSDPRVALLFYGSASGTSH